MASWPAAAPLKVGALVAAAQLRLWQLASTASWVTVWLARVNDWLSKITSSSWVGTQTPLVPLLLKDQCVGSVQRPPLPTQYRVRGVGGLVKVRPELPPLSKLWSAVHWLPPPNVALRSVVRLKTWLAAEPPLGLLNVTRAVPVPPLMVV